MCCMILEPVFISMSQRSWKRENNYEYYVFCTAAPDMDKRKYKTAGTKAPDRTDCIKTTVVAAVTAAVNVFGATVAM